MTTQYGLRQKGPLFRAGALLAVFTFVVLTAGVCWAKPKESDKSPNKVEEIYQKATKTVPKKPGTPSSVTIPVSEYAEYQKLAHSLQVLQENHRHLFTCGAMAAAVLCLFLVLWFVHKRHLPAKESITLVGLVLVIFGVIILIQVVDSERQLTASIGVFGAIVGYLFGSVSSAREPRVEREAPYGETVAAGSKPGDGKAGGPAPDKLGKEGA